MHEVPVHVNATMEEEVGQAGGFGLLEFTVFVSW